MLNNVGYAFGVNKQRSVRMLFFSRNSFAFAYGGVNGTAAVQELEVLFGNLLAYIMSEIAVGNKQYVFASIF